MIAGEARAGLRTAAARLLSPRLVVVAIAALLAIGAPAQARGNHPKPPMFGGLRSATTCIGGPIGPGRTSSYHLGWDPASGRAARPKRFVYEIYQATKPGGEDFSHPTYTTAPGVTFFDTPQLPANERFYYVVRARDRAGNEDSNTVEREGQNLCV